jgi:hypothetical protein
MSFARRRAIYCRQRNTLRSWQLTPRQRRRLRGALQREANRAITTATAAEEA